MTQERGAPRRSPREAIRLVVTGGGTGGHVYPALAITAAWQKLHAATPNAETLYIGSSGGMEQRIVAKSGVPFVGIAAGPLRGKAPWTVAANLVRLVIGLGQSLALLRQRKSVILATGGYVCAPVILAARLLRLPAAIYLPDIEPGWAVRVLSRFVNLVAVTSSRSQAMLPAATIVETGYPVRPEVGTIEKFEARARLGLEPTGPVIVVAGGSRGARSINYAVRDGLPELLELAQVLHVAGQLDEPELRQAAARLPDTLRKRYHLFAYLDDAFIDALSAADLVISRAGASVMGEYPASGLPSVLVPYPHAGAHQEQNANFLVAAGAAVQLPEQELGQLLVVVRDLLEQPGRLDRLRAAARSLARPGAAQHIAELLDQLAAADRRLGEETLDAIDAR